MSEQAPVLTGFHSLKLEHKEVFGRYLAQDPPQTSELTFTNLYMWGHHYRPCWLEKDGLLLAACLTCKGAAFGLPPVGTGDKVAGARFLLEALEGDGYAPRLERVPEELGQTLAAAGFSVEPDRDQSDYVYLRQELIDLPGRRFHRKKNHFNKFIKSQPHEYLPLDQGLVGAVLDLQASWCELRDCLDDPGLRSEDRAIFDAFCAYEQMDFLGGAILIKGKVEAFSLGEKLNQDTAVIHIEKANTDIPGLYAAINQMFCAAAFEDCKYINREQDLGLEGLRAAKESYNPHHMVNKFVVTPTA